MPEQYANNAQTTLAAAIAAADTTITVSSAAGFPSQPQFRIRIDNELLLVTAVSGTTWTVQRGVEGTTAAAHASGATVTHVLTAPRLPIETKKEEKPQEVTRDWMARQVRAQNRMGW